MVILSIDPKNLHDGRAAIAKMRAPMVRSMEQFAEDEIVLPTGPYRGRRFRLHRQPKSRLWLQSVDSGKWNRFVYTGPVQSGKTLDACAIPLMYALFELQETAIFGVPTMDVAADKWREDLRPVIAASRYAKYLPTEGAGARGGTKLESVSFKNGTTLKFMSGHGRDEKRSAFTARIVVITEVDKFDEASEASEETDPITQLERRTAAFGRDAMIFLECTVSHPKGRLWREYNGGRDYDDEISEDAVFSTEGRIAMPCPHCDRYVTPEREHLVGWEDARNAVEAGTMGHLYCPECAEQWTEEQRREANQRSKLVHRGQTIDKLGRVRGEPVPTQTLGFRYNSVNNMFTDVDLVSSAEWKAKNSLGLDDEAGEKDMLQFWWAKPYVPKSPDVTPLDQRKLMSRRERYTKGVVPADTDKLVMGVDLGKRWNWWLLLALREGRQVHVVDYGNFPVWSESLGVDPDVAMAAALHDQLARIVELGFPVEGSTEKRIPDLVGMDTAYFRDRAFEFIRAKNAGYEGQYMATLGRGVTQERKVAYSAPNQKTNTVRKVGDNWHVVKEHEHRIYRTVFNSDYWKSWVHDRLTTPQDKPGAMAFYDSTNDREHKSLVAHLVAEKLTEEFIPGKGVIHRWVAVSRANHWLDCCVIAAVTGNYLGWKVVSESSESEPVEAKSWWGQGTVA